MDVDIDTQILKVTNSDTFTCRGNVMFVTNILYHKWQVDRSVLPASTSHPDPYGILFTIYTKEIAFQYHSFSEYMIISGCEILLT